MKRYLPLLAISILLSAIMGLSYYADISKRHYNERHKRTEAVTVAKIEDTKASDSGNQGYEPPIWAKYITFPEGVGAWAVILTLLAIVWQSIETRKSAEAASRQIDIQRESLRPRLSVGGFVNDVFTEAIRGEWVTVKMKIANSGGTPAYNVIVDTWIEFVPGRPPYQFTTEARYRQAPPMNVATGKPSGFFIPLHRKLTENERYQMANFEGALCFRLRIKYRAFSGDVHTDEAFAVCPKEMETISEYTSAI